MSNVILNSNTVVFFKYFTSGCAMQDGSVESLGGLLWSAVDVLRLNYNDDARIALWYLYHINVDSLLRDFEQEVATNGGKHKNFFGKKKLLPRVFQIRKVIKSFDGIFY